MNNQGDWLDEYVTERLSQESDNREAIHENHDSSRPLSEGYEYIGIAGEWLLGELTGIMPDFSLRPSGDGGTDQVITLAFTVDVKLARKPYNLIHEVGKPFADIFILGKYHEEEKRGEALGWEWGETLKRAPTKDFGYGVNNHYIPRDKLKPMECLKRRIIRPGVQQ